jgi:peroxisomal enoyl-CoA hydratase 2
VSSEGLDLELNGKIIGVYDKGGNMILEAENTLRDAKTNTIYAKLTSTAFGIGQGGYGGSRGPTKPSYPPPKRTPDAVHIFQTTPEQALLYRLSGDYNPMHADDDFGKRAGFKGSILQGLGTWNIAAHAVLKCMGNSDPARFRSFNARFRKMDLTKLFSRQLFNQMGELLCRMDLHVSLAHHRSANFNYSRKHVSCLNINIVSGLLKLLK